MSQKLLDNIQEALLEKIAGIIFTNQLDPDDWYPIIETSKAELAETTMAAVQSNYLGGLSGTEYSNKVHALVAKIELLEDLVVRIDYLSQDTP